MQAAQVLEELRRESMTLAQQGEPKNQGGQSKKSTSKTDGDSKDIEFEVDIDSLMEDIRKDITDIYKVCCDDQNVLEAAKPTIDILREIEHILNKQTQQIKYVYDNDFSKQVIKQVQFRRDMWFARK